MKKKLNEIFDEAKPQEFDQFSDELNAPELPDEVLASVKGKVYAKTKLKSKKKNNGGIWMRVGAIAACFLLIVSAVIVVPMFRDSGDNPIINPPNSDIPSISTMISGNNITGKQELIYGDPSSGSEGEADMIAPGFEIQTVIEAKVIEVLPDTYYYAASYYEPFHVAKLRVVDQIRGDGLPEEIYLCYPYYDTTVFDGYECFIMSLEQVGVENYVLINETQSRVDYFSNMFEVRLTRDLGYGSVIAFNDGKVDESFWEKTDYLVSKVNIGKGVFDHMLDSPSANYFPASRNTAIAKVKSNIIELANDDDNWHVSTRRYNYVTVDDVFISDEAKEIKSYLEPSDTNVFIYSLTLDEERVIAKYTRIINGFRTDERIVVNGYNGENGNVSRDGGIYTEDALAKIPNIGEALANMKLSELNPPHIEIAEGMSFSHSNASGIYRMVDGKVYGIIRVMWYYQYPGIENAYMKDDMYYLYDENGNGKIVERDELREVIGDDYFIQRFSYDGIIAWD